jgi:nitronate monooxygenase
MSTMAKPRNAKIPPVLQKLRIPVIASPMFTVSYPELVLAQCESGIVGSFPALNARQPELLDEWLHRMNESLAATRAADPCRIVGPLAVNQISHSSNVRLTQDMETCIRHRVPIIISSLRAPVREIVDAVHGYGGIILHDVISLRHAEKALEAGVDGLIAVAAGAGGHAGVKSPFALIAEIRQWFDGPLALSGAISSGGAVLAARAMGADFAYIGSAFIATEEARAQPAYKQMIVESTSDDIVYSSLFTGVHGNYLKGSIRNAGLDPDALPESDPSKMDFGGAAGKAWKDIWGCGQGIAAIKEVVPARVLVARLAAEYREAQQRVL